MFPTISGLNAEIRLSPPCMNPKLNYNLVFSILEAQAEKGHSEKYLIIPLNQSLVFPPGSEIPGLNVQLRKNNLQQLLCYSGFNSSLAGSAQVKLFSHEEPPGPWASVSNTRT